MSDRPYIVTLRMSEAEVGLMRAADGGLTWMGLEVSGVMEIVPAGWGRQVYEANPWDFSIPEDAR